MPDAAGLLDRFEEEGVKFLCKVRDAYLDNKKLDEKRIQQIDGKKDINQILFLFYQITNLM